MGQPLPIDRDHGQEPLTQSADRVAEGDVLRGGDDIPLERTVDRLASSRLGIQVSAESGSPLGRYRRIENGKILVAFWRDLHRIGGGPGLDREVD